MFSLLCCSAVLLITAVGSTSIIGKATIDDYLYWDQEFMCPPGSMLDTLAKVPMTGKNGKDYRFFGTCRPYHGPNCYRLCYWGSSCKAVGDHMEWPIGTAEVANYVAGMRSRYNGKLRDVELLCCVTPAAVFAAPCVYSRWSQDDESLVSGYDALLEFGREGQKDNRFTAFKDLHIVRYEDNTMVFRFLICPTWPMMKWDCSRTQRMPITAWDEKIPPALKRAAVHAAIWPPLGGMAFGLGIGLINECISSPCLCGGTCTDGWLQYTCSCPTGCTGTRCETVTCPTTSTMSDEQTTLTLSMFAPITTVTAASAAACAVACFDDATCMQFAFDGTTCQVSLSTTLVCPGTARVDSLPCSSCATKLCKCTSGLTTNQPKLSEVTIAALCTSPTTTPDEFTNNNGQFCF